MPRYFLEVAYKGTAYSGFQAQYNANTIQAEVEKAFKALINEPISLTCSSRTDAGVHALQNFFHFDTEKLFETGKLYNLNAILPKDIVAKGIYEVASDAHCRYDAFAREYKYFIYDKKNPFLNEEAYYYPFALDVDSMNAAAKSIMNFTNFESFSKRNTQVNHFECNMIRSKWREENGCLVYNVKANRFLRGMVKGLVGTMLKVGRQKLTIDQFEMVIKSRDCSNADFSPSSKGLFLVSVSYPAGLLG
jgi:tRNA pseudouridine38-40 synthase